jgi:hypothetical protein
MEDYVHRQGEIQECTFCPPNTKQCAHIDGYWVRLTVGPNSVDTHYPSGVPAVARNFPLPSEDWYYVNSVTVFYLSWTVSDAQEWFDKLDAEMRKIARGYPGDVCT